MTLTMTLAGPRLFEPSTRDVMKLAYVRGCIMQISPTQAALLVALKVIDSHIVDFAGGTDVIVFDHLDQIQPQRAAPLMRNGPAVHPRSGKPLIMVKHLVMGGFVPLGAKLNNGLPHPHAGTGFGLATCVGYPAALDEPNPHVARDSHRYHELQQYRFDGGRFEVLSTEVFIDEGPVAGWHMANRPLSNAIPDGEDLVMGIVAGPLEGGGDRFDRGGRKHGSAFTRWRYGRDGWRPVSIVMVSGQDQAYEPSMVRDVDGSLLMTVRGSGSRAAPGELDDTDLENTAEHFRVWRSADSGASWQRVIHLKQQRAPSPVVINRTAGGQPFLTANPYVALSVDSQGRKVMATRQRARLCFWPLTADRRDVQQPVCVLDANKTFDPLPPIPGAAHDALWYIDHPIGGVYRLADGQWHSLICFRVLAGQSAGSLSSPSQCGCWVERVTAADEEGSAMPAWSF